MKLALGTSWLAAAAGVWAAPRPVRPSRAMLAGELPSEAALQSPEGLCRPAAEGYEPTVHCLRLRKRDDEQHTSTTLATFVLATTSSDASIPSRKPSSSRMQTMPSLQPTSSMTNPETESSSSSNSGLSNDQLRTIGIVGGFLAGIALIAVIGIVVILIRNQRRARSSTTSGSTRTRSRTHSRAQQPPPFLQETSESTFPISRPPPLHIYTDRHAPTAPTAPTMVSRDMTTATIGHHGEMLQFPVASGQESASSRSLSFHSVSGGSNTPRRAPQLPSLGLSQARPFLRSVTSAFSYHASAGHPSPTTQEPTDTSATHEEATASVSGSKTLTTTEDATRTAPVEESSEHSVKPSSQ
ncbi:hypothetical protein FS749_007765 [Ceratobasidium sp. UAMH 11750]|nr:hypothetical protein FS749_007765 [Ceratobasidium sp. UAMH 11750]